LPIRWLLHSQQAVRGFTLGHAVVADVPDQYDKQCHDRKKVVDALHGFFRAAARVGSEAAVLSDERRIVHLTPLPWRELHGWRALDEAQEHPQKPERAAEIAQALAVAHKQPLHMGEIEVLRKFVAAL